MVPSDSVISKRQMDFTKNRFTIKLVRIMAIFGTIAVFPSGPVTFFRGQYFRFKYGRTIVR